MLHQNNGGMQKPGGAGGSAIADAARPARIEQPDGCRLRERVAEWRHSVADRLVRSSSRPCTRARTPLGGQTSPPASAGSISASGITRPIGLLAGRARASSSAIASVEREIAAAGPPQRREVRTGAEPLAEIVRQRADVEAGGAVHRSVIAIACDASTSSRRVDGDASPAAGGQRAAAGAGRSSSGGVAARAAGARARQLVAALPVDLLRRKGRRLLQERAAERVERGARSRRATAAVRRMRAPIAVPARRRCRSRSRAGRRRRRSCRWRSGIARAASPGRPPAAARRWPAGSSVPVWPMRRSRSARRTRATTSCDVGPGRLVDDEQAVHRMQTVDRAIRSRSRSSRRTVFCSGVDRAGDRCSRPRSCGRRRRIPSRRAPMSMSPFERMLTRYSSPSTCLKKTTAWISFTVSGRLISPSVSSYVPPAARAIS